MALLNESVESKKLDVRLVERNLTRGVLSSSELETSLKNLPDDSENAEWVDVDSLMEEFLEKKPAAKSEGRYNGHAPLAQH